MTEQDLKLESRSWYVVKAKAFCERTAAANLRDQGFEVYLPMALMVDRKTNEVKGRPLFARYLFVRFSERVDQWRCIFSTRGVQSLVCSAGGKPMVACDANIENIRVREVDGMINMVAVKPERSFTKGQRVKIDDGELEGIFCEAVDKTRSILLLNFLNRESRVTVHSARLS
jgi:transcriptional antiterminator RfaH